MIKLLDYRKNPSQLRKPGKKFPVSEIKAIASTVDFQQRLAEMEKILAVDGVGLAATQVGWEAQLFMLCIDEDGNKIEPQIFLNPEIIGHSKAEEKMEEGCLSFPGLFLKIKRPESVTWKYHTLDGAERVVESSGFYARAVQHETDHCQGRVFIDRASNVHKIKIKKWHKR